MGGAVSTGADHDDLIDKLKEAKFIRTSTVENVFRSVDRGFYFLPESIDDAYRDMAWKCGNLHLSAPCIYAEVMENLCLEPGLSFLNLGSGTGYLSTMVGLLLGSYGLNHGIELFPDVIEYAYNKLNEFKRSSPALDGYEFCEPKFIRGNILCLSSSSRQYDRVYCGATCPRIHENYVKNLLKIGGILVMPVNDKLVKVTRKSETEWETVEVLCVTFSVMKDATPEEANSPIFLPEAEPPLLQEMCRSVIRRLLKAKAEEDHPTIKVKRRKYHVSASARDSLRGKVNLYPHLIIPIIESSEEDGNDGAGGRAAGGEEAGAEASPPRPPSPTPANNHRPAIATLFRRTRRIGAIVNIATAALRRESPGNRLRQENSDRRVEREDENENRDAAARRRVFLLREDDLGLMEDDNRAGRSDSGQVLSGEGANKSGIRVSSGDEEEDDDDDANGVRSGPPPRNRIKFDSGVGMDPSSDSESSDQMDLESDSDSTHYSGNSRSHKSSLKHTSVSEDSESTPVYSDVMRQGIQALPLPPTLKSYLNFYRDF